MAVNQKITELAELTSPVAEDVLAIVDDPAGAGKKTKKVVVSNLVRSFSITAAETAAGVTPVDFQYEPGQVARYGNNTTPGTTDMNTAIQAAIDSEGDDGHVIFTEGIGELFFTTVTVDRERVLLGGNAKLNGTIRVRHFNFDTTNSLNQFVTLDGLNFVSSGQTKDAIILGSTRRNAILGCHFEGYDKAIAIPENVDNAFGQHVNRHRILGNTYIDVNYFVHEIKTAGITSSFADSIINENEGTALITHVELDTVDGLTLADNIMFFSGFAEESAVKERHIHITSGAWLNIHDNKLFEAGLEAVKLDKCSRYSLHDNLYAFAGERLESVALLITGTPVAGAYFSQGEVHDEIMIDPTGVGIQVDAKAGRLKIHNNSVQTPDAAANSRYYGVPALTGGLEAVLIDADTIDITTNDNTTRWSSWTANVGINQSNTHYNNVVDSAGDGSSTRTETNRKTKTETGTETTIVVTRWAVVNLSQSGATDVTAFTNDDGVSKTVLFKAFNANTTFKHDGVNIFLAGDADANPGTGGTITFDIGTDNVARETGRAL